MVLNSDITKADIVKVKFKIYPQIFCRAELNPPYLNSLLIGVTVSGSYSTFICGFIINSHFYI